MSLISSIKTRRVEDIMNQGYRASLTGTVATVTDNVILSGVADRAFVCMSFILTTDSASNISVSLGYRTGSTTTKFFEGYLTAAGGPLSFTYGMGDEKYSELGHSLVITTSAGNVKYSINGRVISEKVPLGYIEHLGAPAHNTSPYFPAESGRDRGQSESSGF